MPSASAVAESALDLIAATPVLRMNRVVPAGAAEVWAKLESYNPGGSVKDRICLAMIEDAERAGRLQRGCDHRRADERQHRHRPRAGVRRQGLPADPDDARHDERGAPQPAHRLRREARPHARHARHARRDPQGRGDRDGASGLFHAAAVLQSGQSRDPPPHDGAGAARAVRAHRCVRRRRRHRRHDHRRRRGAAGAHARRPDRRGRAGSLAGAVGRRARLPQDPRLGRGLRPGDPQYRDLRRGHRR